MSNHQGASKRKASTGTVGTRRKLQTHEPTRGLSGETRRDMVTAPWLSGKRGSSVLKKKGANKTHWG